MPSTITICCQGGCGRRWMVSGQDYDAWRIPDTCKECEDRQHAEYFQQGEQTDSTSKEHHADHRQDQ